MRRPDASPLGADLASINAASMGERVARLRAIEQRTRTVSAESRAHFERRGQLLPRERVATLIDPDAPLLELSTLAGYLRDTNDPQQSVAGGGLITAIAEICGRRVMLVASDSGIQAGALGMPGLEKLLRAQEIALTQRLPFVHLVESAGANLLDYRVEHFIRGGAAFYNLARLSAAGIPVITVVHGASTAGGAYMPGLSDVVIMVRDRAYAFLAGPALLRAATGEVADEESLGGAGMHASVTGLADYLAENDEHALALARSVIAAMIPDETEPVRSVWREPEHEVDAMLSVMPADPRQPADMRKVIELWADHESFIEFKAAYGDNTVVGHASLYGQTVGIVTNNGPIDPDGACKATHFVQLCGQSGCPIVFLHNTTGFLVGQEPERAGMIKHGAKMIQAISNVNVPRIAIHCGASYGAGNYAMCGYGFRPDFCFSWPNARTAVMGADQAAMTMAMVMEAAARRKLKEPDQTAIESMKQRIADNFTAQADVFVTSGMMLDDGVIDPRDTRKVLGLAIDTARRAQLRALHPVQFGVARA